MNWFDQIRQALPDYYPDSGASDIVGYLRGSISPKVWRQMETDQNRNQMLILGSTEPTLEEWTAAGVASRLDDGPSQVVRLNSLAGFIVLYGGFMLRPWGKICISDRDALNLGFPASIRSWTQEYRRRRP